MLIISNINKSIIATPSIAMDYAIGTDSSAYNPLQCSGRAVWNKFCINSSIAFIDAKDRLLQRTSASFPGAWSSSKPSWPEEAFINFNNTYKFLFFRVLMFINKCAKSIKITINCFPV